MRLSKLYIYIEDANGSELHLLGTQTPPKEGFPTDVEEICSCEYYCSACNDLHEIHVLGSEFHAPEAVPHLPPLEFDDPFVDEDYLAGEGLDI